MGKKLSRKLMHKRELDEEPFARGTASASGVPRRAVARRGRGGARTRGQTHTRAHVVTMGCLGSARTARSARLPEAEIQEARVAEARAEMLDKSQL